MLLTAPDSAVSRLIRAFALPKEFGDGIRMASEGSGIKTATANLTTLYPASTWGAATADTRIPAGEMMAFLFPNLARSFVYYDHNPSAQTMTYAGQFSQGTTSVNCYPFQTTKIQPRYYTPSTSYRPHGDFLFCGEDGDSLYTPLDQGNSLFVTLTPAPGTVNGRVNFYLWDGKRGIPVATQAFVVGQQNYPHVALVPGDYYATVSNHDGVTLAAATAINGTSPVWCHRSVSNIDNLLTSCAGVRCNFSACKSQNTSNVQDKNGNIVSVTASSAIPWRQYATGFSAIAALDGMSTRIAEKGNYVFNVPDSDNDIDEFYDDITFGGFPGSLSQISYPLSERQPYKIIALSVPTAAGRSFTFEVTHVLEYLSNVRLVEKDISSFSPDQVSAAVQLLRTMATDYDNDTHIGEILASIGKYLPRGAAAMSKLLRVFSSNSPAVGAAADFLDSSEGAISQFANSLKSFKRKKK